MQENAINHNVIAAAIKHIWGIVNNRTSQMTSTGNNVRIRLTSFTKNSPNYTTALWILSDGHCFDVQVQLIYDHSPNWSDSMPPTIEFDVWMVATMYWVKAIIYLVPLPYTILSYFQRIYAGEGIHTRQKTKKSEKYKKR